MISQHLSTFLTGLLSGLLAAGLVLLFLSHPKRYPIRLLPPPTPSPLRIDVTGAVHNPGIYLVPVEAIWETALIAAGGNLPDADLERINLAATIEDGQHVFVPFQETGTTSITSTSPVLLNNDALIDVNQVTAAEVVDCMV